MPAPQLKWLPYEVRAAPRLLTADAPAGTVHLPDLSDFPRPLDKARVLLQSAAEVEHALMVQYLYAAYSLKTRDQVTEPAQQDALDPSLDASWPLVVLGIAREEMGHLLTVQNLLLLLGLAPHLEREVFPPRNDLYPFKLHLERLSQRSLAKYVAAESPRDATGIDDIVALARESAGEDVNRVGVVYGLLGLVFSAAGTIGGSGDPAWDELVAELAGAAFQQAPPEAWHLPDDAFHPGSGDLQGTPEDWQIGNVRVHRVTDRAGAIQALRDVGEQGEGPTSLDEASHYARFLQMYRGGSDLPPFPAEGEWVPTRDVPLDPAIDAIAEPRTRRWAELADLRYALLLGFLGDLLLTTGNRRPLLVGWSFAEMRSRLGIIGRQLTTMPRGGGAGVAALPFTVPADLALPADEPARLRVHAARTSASIAKVEQMQAADPADRDDPFLSELLTTDRARLAYLEAPGATTSFVRDILPLFRPKDVAHMRRFRVVLDRHAEVKAKAELILQRLEQEGRQMPPRPDPRWTAGQIELFARWMAEGFPE
jgi:hypothetical protein